MSYRINGIYVHPCLLLRADLGHHTMCHGCGAVKDTKLCGGVVICKRCSTFWDKDTCRELSNEEATIKMFCCEEEE